MLLAQEKYQVWHYPDSGSRPSSIIAWACDFSLHQFLKEFLRLLHWGWTGYLLKMEILGHHTVGCCWWIGEPGSLFGSLL